MLSFSRAFVWATIAIAILVVVTSSMGILVESTYARETTDWTTQARAQDMVNLMAVEVLLAAGFFASRGSLRGMLVWTGVILFLIYSFVIYAFATHFNELFLVYVVALGACVYTFIGGALRLDFETFRDKFPREGRLRAALSVFLVLLALIFYVLWLSEDVPALLAGSTPASIGQAGLLTNPVHVLDIGLYLPAVLGTGISLWRKGSVGLFFAAPMLLFSVFTGLGILFIDILSGASAAANAGQETFVSVMTIISLILAWLYLRETSGSLL